MPDMKCHHREGCKCDRIAFERQARLSAASRVLAAEAARYSAPATVENALLREMANVQRLRRRRIAYSVGSGAIAAALALTVWMTHRIAPGPRVVAIAPHVEPVAATVVMAAEPVVVKHRGRAVKPKPAPQTPFISIPYTLPLQPYERADVMRMDVPVAALIAVGLPISMADPAAVARADVLVGQDGRARAIRLVTSSN